MRWITPVSSTVSLWIHPEKMNSAIAGTSQQAARTVPPARGKGRGERRGEGIVGSICSETRRHDDVTAATRLLRPRSFAGMRPSPEHYALPISLLAMIYRANHG